MNTEEKETTAAAAPPPPAPSKGEVALELMKFIAVTTGMGKSSSGAGFGGKSQKTTEEHVDALIQLYERCRTVVDKS